MGGGDKKLQFDGIQIQGFFNYANGTFSNIFDDSVCENTVPSEARTEAKKLEIMGKERGIPEFFAPSAIPLDEKAIHAIAMCGVALVNADAYYMIPTDANGVPHAKPLTKAPAGALLAYLRHASLLRKKPC